MKITLTMLRRAGACKPQVKRFAELFGEEADVTEELCVQHAQEFEWDWAASNLLDDDQQKIYREARASAEKIYREACAPAKKIYDETIASAGKIYREARASAEKIYREACAPAKKIYDKTRSSALKIYNETCASAFALACTLSDKQ